MNANNKKKNNLDDRTYFFAQKNRQIDLTLS